MMQHDAVSEAERFTVAPPPFDANAPLQFVINGRAGTADTDEKHDAITAALQDAQHTGRVWCAGDGALDGIAREAVGAAQREGSAVIAVGGDGTINTVAQIAHAAGCPMGVIPQGTFNYFAREHGVPTEIEDAVRWLLTARPAPVPVSAINDRLFLVNASLGLYPELLQDRERWQARFGRGRVISLGAAVATLLRARATLRLRVTWEARVRDLRTLTLFVGNNQLQLEQLGLVESHADRVDTTPAVGVHHLVAVMLKPIGTGAMLRLMLRGAMGQLGGADGVEHFPSQELVVAPSFGWRGRTMQVAFDGEVAWMRPPLVIRVLPAPLWLLKRSAASAA